MIHIDFYINIKEIMRVGLYLFSGLSITLIIAYCIKREKEWKEYE
mgnify:CR=1 FL=1